MQLVCDGQVVYRRHAKDGALIYVDDRNTLLKYARRHCYSFQFLLANGSLIYALDYVTLPCDRAATCTARLLLVQH